MKIFENKQDPFVEHINELCEKKHQLNQLSNVIGEIRDVIRNINKKNETSEVTKDLNKSK